MTDAVLFDWDGTLLDSREALLGAWHASTEEVVGRRYPATADEEELVFTLSGAVLVPRLVDVVVCQEDTEAHKPDPEPVLHALRALGVEPSRAVMAGDTPVDLEAGLAAGTKVVGVTWGAGSPAALRAAGATTLARDAGQ